MFSPTFAFTHVSLHFRNGVAKLNYYIDLFIYLLLLLLLFRLEQAPAYFQELMTGILKDFPFAIAYLDDIIIFSKTPQEHLSHICMVFKKLK